MLHSGIIKSLDWSVNVKDLNALAYHAKNSTFLSHVLSRAYPIEQCILDNNAEKQQP